MQHGAVLGLVDFLAGEHLLDLGLEVGGLGELEERLHDVLVDAVLGVVKRPASRRKRVLGRAVGVRREQLLDRRLLRRRNRGFDLLPCFLIHLSPFL